MEERESVLVSDTRRWGYADGYAKMNDRCVACGAEATLGILVTVAAKLGVSLVLCAKFLDKATRRTYTVHIAFAAVVFTAQVGCA